MPVVLSRFLVLLDVTGSDRANVKTEKPAIAPLCEFDWTTDPEAAP